MKKKSVILWIVLGLILPLYISSVYDRLPEMFPTHFDMEGNPNGWSEKLEFITLFGVLILFSNLVVGGLYAFIEKMPQSLVNLPNKDYWFANPERSLRAYALLRTILALTGAFTNLVFLFCLHLIFQEASAVKWPHIPVNAGVAALFALTFVFVGYILLISLRKD